MKATFFETLASLAEDDPAVFLLVGDLGFGAVEPFAERFPDRFLNVGVAEQNMTGIAAGLALSGRTVFTYSIGNFPTLRPLEQIRNDICYQRANVKTVAVGGGYAYGALGSTHHATEDLAIMRALPEMVVVAPGDLVETRSATRAIAAHDGPCYLRLGRAGERSVHPPDVAFALGRAIRVRDGDDLTLVSTGNMLHLAMTVAETLAVQGVSARVLSMHTVKPIDTEAVRTAARETPLVVTLEEHSIIGGLGGAVAEVLAESDDTTARFRRLGLPPEFCRKVGSQSYLLNHCGLSAAGILESIQSSLRSTRASAE